MSKKYLYHTHHIIPKHAGGTDDPSNLIKLTVEEHALAHRKLFFIYGRWQDEMAYKTLEGRAPKEEIIREVIRRTNTGKKLTPEQKQRKREWNIANGHKPPSWLGKKHKPETIVKMCNSWTEERKKEQSERNKGKIVSTETREKLRKSNTGKKHSSETKEILRQKALGRKNPAVSLANKRRHQLCWIKK